MFKKECDSNINWTRDPQTPPLVLLPAQTEAQKIAHFTAELDSALQSLDKATAQSVKTSDKMQKLNAALQDRGWWDAFRGNLNGQTDKELAENVQALGGSLETTQKVIRVMLQVQTNKGRLLHTFNDALVNKIFLIQTDTKTLDDNQRAAALAFLEELQQRVQEQIRQQDLIEDHEQKLLDLSQWKFEKNHQDMALEQQLKGFMSGVEALRKMVIGLDEWREAKRGDDQNLSAQIAKIEQQNFQKFDQIINSIATIQGAQARLTDQLQAFRRNIDALQARVVEFERVQAHTGSFMGVLSRHGLSLVALGTAMAALIRSLGV